MLPIDISIARKVLLAKFISEQTRNQKGELRLGLMDALNWVITKEETENPQYYWLLRYGYMANDQAYWDEYLSEVIYRILYSYDKSFPIQPQQYRGTWRTPIEVRYRDPIFREYHDKMLRYILGIYFRYKISIEANVKTISRTIKGITIKDTDVLLWWL